MNFEINEETGKFFKKIGLPENPVEAIGKLCQIVSEDGKRVTAGKIISICNINLNGNVEIRINGPKDFQFLLKYDGLIGVYFDDSDNHIMGKLTVLK